MIVERMTIGQYSTKVAQERLSVVQELASEIYVLGICETWMRKDDTDVPKLWMYMQI